MRVLIVLSFVVALASCSKKPKVCHPDELSDDEKSWLCPSKDVVYYSNQGDTIHGRLIACTESKDAGSKEGLQGCSQMWVTGVLVETSCNNGTYALFRIRHDTPPQITCKKPLYNMFNYDPFSPPVATLGGSPSYDDTYIVNFPNVSDTITPVTIHYSKGRGAIKMVMKTGRTYFLK